MHIHRWHSAGWLLAGLIGLLAISAAGGPLRAQDGATPTPFYATSADPALNARMDFVERATSILRDLAPLAPVTRALLSRAELLAYLETVLDEEYPPQRARDDALFYHAFDFMPADTDLRQVQLDVLAEQIGGFYDTDLAAMFVISTRAELSAVNQILYAHEYTHALQDQHFDLDALGVEGDPAAANPDGALAAIALVEGDAMLMTEGYQLWLLRESPGLAFNLLSDALLVETEALLAAPPILRAELLFPYTAGREFAYVLFAGPEGGWAGVNAAYADPPQTTEQIIHPERYLAGEAARMVSVPPLEAALGPGEWRLVWDRSLGEFYLREQLRQSLPRNLADGAAAGWGGDRYRLYVEETTGASVLAWRAAWDSPRDAAEFSAAYQSYAARLYSDAPGYPIDEATVCWYGADVRCLRSDTQETLVIRVPEQAVVAEVLRFASQVLNGEF